jgi:hypothetical protein
MAEIAFDPNQQDSSNTTTNILSNQASNAAENNQQSISTSGQNYVSNGNPYGAYGTPQSGNPQPNQSNEETSVKKTTSKAPSSGQHTNVQSYMDKNQMGSQQLGESVSNKVQTSADLARQNMEGTQKSFNQGMESGSLKDWEIANKEAMSAYQKAASLGTQSAVERARIRDLAPHNRPITDDRLSDILNAKYEGPKDLHEMDSYADTFNQYQKAGSLQDLAKSRGFKGTLLKETFQNPTNNYSLGNQLLDDMLLGQGKAAETLKQTADNLGQAPSGKIGDEFESRVSEARDSALSRAANIDDVRTQARADLDSVASGRSDQVEARMAKIVKDWDKYPDYYRKVLQEELNKHNTAKSAFGSFSNVNTQLGDLRGTLNKAGYAPFGGDTRSLTEKFSSGTAPKQVYDEYKKLNSEKAQLQYELDNKYKPYFDPNYGSLTAQYYPEEYKKALTAQNRLKQINTGISEIEKMAPVNNQFTFDGQSLSGLSSQGSLEDRLRSLQQTTAKEYDQYKQLSQQEANYLKQIEAMNKKYGVDFNKFDPNSMNIGLSALEAEMLGIKGGEGLYNQLSQKDGIDNIIKTAKADKNKLISKDEQSQLSRLQSIAELANDYGSVDSGIDFNNKYTNKKLAGTQNALSALDLGNLQNKLQSSEKEFRDFADARTETGVGVGKGSSGGLFGKKTKKVTAYETANLGDVLDKAKANRDMYSTKGVDKKTVDKILGLSKTLAENDGLYGSGTDSGVPQISRAGQEYLGKNSILGKASGMSGVLTGDVGSTIEGIGGLTGDVANIYKNIVGKTPVLAQHAGALGEIGKGVSDVGSAVSSGMFGSSGSAAKKAASNAQAAAIADLQNKITATLNKQGYGNQFVKQNNTQRDAELLKLLGLLDTTNR